MDHLGLWALGVFLGAVSTLGFLYISSSNAINDWKSVLGVCLPALFAGVALSFVDRFKFGPALAFYPLGILAGFLWSFYYRPIANAVGAPPGVPQQAPNGTSADNRSLIQRFEGMSAKPSKAVLYWHLCASIFVTGLGLVGALAPAWRYVEAEWSIPKTDNIEYFKKVRPLPTKPASEPKSLDLGNVDKAKLEVVTEKSSTKESAKPADGNKDATQTAAPAPKK